MRGTRFTLALRRTAGPVARVRITARTVSRYRVAGRLEQVAVVRRSTVLVGTRGPAKARLTLTTAGRRLLRRHGRLTVRLTFAPADGQGPTRNQRIVLRTGSAR